MLRHLLPIVNRSTGEGKFRRVDDRPVLKNLGKICRPLCQNLAHLMKIPIVSVWNFHHQPEKMAHGSAF
jgi:hypothetical protein